MPSLTTSMPSRPQNGGIIRIDGRTEEHDAAAVSRPVPVQLEQQYARGAGAAGTEPAPSAVLTLLYRQGVALDLNAARLKDLCWVETADVMKFHRLLAAFEYDTEDLDAFFERWLENHAGQYDLNWFISHTAPLDKGQRQEILRNDLSYLNALYSGRLHLDFGSIRHHQFPILTYAVQHGRSIFWIW